MLRLSEWLEEASRVLDSGFFKVFLSFVSSAARAKCCASLWEAAVIPLMAQVAANKQTIMVNNMKNSLYYDPERHLNYQGPRRLNRSPGPRLSRS